MLTSFFDEALGNQGISPKSQNSSKAFHEILLFLELPKLCKNVLEELPCGGLYFDQKWTPPAFRLTLDPTAKLLSFQLIFQLVNCWKMSQTLVGKWDRIMRRFHCWMIEIIQWYYNCCRRKWCCLPWFFVNFSLEDYENERWRQRDYDYCRLTESHFMPVTDNWELYGSSSHGETFVCLPFVDELNIQFWGDSIKNIDIYIFFKSQN